MRRSFTDINKSVQRTVAVELETLARVLDAQVTHTHTHTHTRARVRTHTKTHTHTHTNTHLHDLCSGDLSNTPTLCGISFEPYRSEESSCIFFLMVCICKTFKTTYFFMFSSTRFRRSRALWDRCCISTSWNHVFCINVMGHMFYINVMGSRVLYERYGTPCFISTLGETLHGFLFGRHESHNLYINITLAFNINIDFLKKKLKYICM